MDEGLASEKKKQEKKPAQDKFCKPLMWIAVVLAFILLGLLVYHMMKPAAAPTVGGRKWGRRRMRGGDCGCAATPQ